jgi:hypothetical protein
MKVWIYEIYAHSEDGNSDIKIVYEYVNLPKVILF